MTGDRRLHQIDEDRGPQPNITRTGIVNVREIFLSKNYEIKDSSSTY